MNRRGKPHLMRAPYSHYTVGSSRWRGPAARSTSASPACGGA